MSVEVSPKAARLAGKLKCDVVIMGSGIAGLSAAYELAQTGQKVIVLDRGSIAGGMTARTTAHLAPICDDAISALINLRGVEIAKQFQQSQEAAVARIEQNVSDLSISCNFRRLDAFLFPAMGMKVKDAREQCAKEYKAARKVGAAVSKVIGVPLKGFENKPVLKYPDQATFHPLKYLRGLAAAIRAKRGRLFANSPVIKIDEQKSSVRVMTERGGVVEASYAIVATNSPISTVAALHSKMAPYRTYAMAFALPKGGLPDALYWDMDDPYHYVRLNPGPGTIDYLIAGGADHKSGEADDGDVRFEAVEAWIRELVPGLGKEITRWSGQVLDTTDYCGFIGLNPGSSRTFVITGDSGQGMTHGALAGLLLRDLIIGASNPWLDVYDPARKTPAGIGNFIRENLTVVRSLAKKLMPGELGSIDELKPGKGGILRDGRVKIAACRDAGGELHLNSASCAHLGCEIQWNTTEQCWDCPCHGSQFAPDGAVLNGPATTPLRKVRLSV
jgi:glycine/D-amino acid oxidase-like deaminating enzyme/nitrite reductase/ring-hydroxylating ferredoxin subunit